MRFANVMSLSHDSCGHSFCQTFGHSSFKHCVSLFLSQFVRFFVLPMTHSDSTPYMTIDLAKGNFAAPFDIYWINTTLKKMNPRIAT